jgi:hypothetical protein
MALKLNRRKLLAGAGIAALLAATMYACSGPTYTFRYRLRVAVKIDGQVYEGSSVNEMSYHVLSKSERWLPDFPSVRRSTWGEAVIIDCGPHGLLFGLVECPPGWEAFRATDVVDILGRLLPPELQNDGKSVLQQLSALPGVYELPEKSRPLLVRFANIKDPKSVTFVEADRFAEIFGKGSSYLRATISITEDPITERLSTVLPWLSGVRTSFEKGWPDGVTRNKWPAPQQLSRHNFKSNGD